MDLYDCKYYEGTEGFLVCIDDFSKVFADKNPKGYSKFKILKMTEGDLSGLTKKRLRKAIRELGLNPDKYSRRIKTKVDPDRYKVFVTFLPLWILLAGLFKINDKTNLFLVHILADKLKEEWKSKLIEKINPS